MKKRSYTAKRQMKRILKKQADGYWTYGSFSLWEKVTEKRKGDNFGFRNIVVFDQQGTKVAALRTIEKAQQYVDHYLKH